jgi:hypothetical protein
VLAQGVCACWQVTVFHALLSRLRSWLMKVFGWDIGPFSGS